MFDLDKSLILATFKVNRENNTKYWILIVSYAYSINITNLDIKVVI